MIISLIAAMDEERGIGYQNDLPWRGKIPADMKHFRELTTGHTILMGRKTYESMGRALPNRRNIVITHNVAFSAPDIEIFSSPDEALKLLENEGADEVFIIGGSQIFASFLDSADRMYLTYIEGKFPSDVHFPDFTEEDWRTSSETNHPADEKNLYPLRFVTLERK